MSNLRNSGLVWVMGRLFHKPLAAMIETVSCSTRQQVLQRLRPRNRFSWRLFKPWKRDLSKFAGTQFTVVTAVMFRYLHWQNQRRLLKLMLITTKEATNQRGESRCSKGSHQSAWKTTRISRLAGLRVAPPSFTNLNIQHCGTLIELLKWTYSI